MRSMRMCKSWNERSHERETQIIISIDMWTCNEYKIKSFTIRLYKIATAQANISRTMNTQTEWLCELPTNWLIAINLNLVGRKIE